MMTANPPTDPAPLPAPETMTVRALIADDERLMRDQLRQRLLAAWPALSIVAEAANGLQAIEAVAEHQPDVVFLDIRMPGLSGLDAARGISDWAQDAPEARRCPEVVFITAYEEHALEAFERGAIDYVLKPADPERLARTVARIQQRLSARSSPRPTQGPAATDGDEGPDAPGTRAPEAASLHALLNTLAAQLGPQGAGGHRHFQYIQASVGATLRMIPVLDVLFFISDEKYTRVQTAGFEALIRKPIKELVAELDGEQFWQIHRSTLVNVKAISGVVRDDRGHQRVTLHGSHESLEVSRSYTHLFKSM